MENNKDNEEFPKPADGKSQQESQTLDCFTEWYQRTIFYESLQPKEHAALLQKAPHPVEMTSLHSFLSGHLSLRWLTETLNGEPSDALIPPQLHTQLLAFISSVRNKDQFLEEAYQAAQTLTPSDYQAALVPEPATPTAQERAFKRLLTKYDPHTLL
ncbi:MAG: hypothetical protein K6F46_01995 [Desulfovibrio sp.]|nr:hypothetical protein [Desulfovibrio sp.]